MSQHHSRGKCNILSKDQNNIVIIAKSIYRGKCNMLSKDQNITVIIAKSIYRQRHSWSIARKACGVNSKQHA